MPSLRAEAAEFVPRRSDDPLLSMDRHAPSLLDASAAEAETSERLENTEALLDAPQQLREVSLRSASIQAMTEQDASEFPADRSAQLQSLTVLLDAPSKPSDVSLSRQTDMLPEHGHIASDDPPEVSCAPAQLLDIVIPHVQAALLKTIECLVKAVDTRCGDIEAVLKSKGLVVDPMQDMVLKTSEYMMKAVDTRCGDIEAVLKSKGLVDENPKTSNAAHESDNEIDSARGFRIAPISQRWMNGPSNQPHRPLGTAGGNVGASRHVPSEIEKRLRRSPNKRK